MEPNPWNNRTAARGVPPPLRGRAPRPGSVAAAAAQAGRPASVPVMPGTRGGRPASAVPGAQAGGPASTMPGGNLNNAGAPPPIVPAANPWEARKRLMAANAGGATAWSANQAVTPGGETNGQGTSVEPVKQVQVAVPVASGAGGGAAVENQENAEGSGATSGANEQKVPLAAKGSSNANVWEARKRLQAMTVTEGSVATDEKKDEEEVKPAKEESAPQVKPKSPVVPKESLAVVQEITPKLTVLGDAPVDQTRIRPFRPSPTGQRKYPIIPVTANHFPVKFDPRTFPKHVYHYDVVITPKELKAKGDQEDSLETTVPDRLLHVIWRKFEETFHRQLGARIPFDGKKNCYTAKPLKLGKNNAWNDEITMVDPDDDDKMRTYRIQLKLANEVNTASVFTYLKTCKTWDHCELPQEVIQALDVALRYCPALNYTPCNRSFYSSKNPHSLSDMLELWFGHNQSLLLGRDEKATLNVDMANKAFMKRLPVERLLRMQLGINQVDMMATNRWKPSDYRRAEEFLKGKLIEYGTGQVKNGIYEKHHRFVAVKVVEHSASSYSFTLNDQEMTIQQYFQKEKGISLKHPEWPVIHVGNKNMTNFVPIELCQIVPQAYKGKLEAADTSEMIKGAAKPPKDRFKRIEESRRNCYFEKCPILKEFGLSVDPGMIQIDAIKLPKPQMNYRNERGNEESVEPKGADGKFQIGQFLKGAEVPKLAILNACGRNTDSFRDSVKRGFLRHLGEEARRLGMVTLDMGKGRPPVDRLFSEAKYEEVRARIIRGGNQTEMPFILAVRDHLRRFKDEGFGMVFVIIGKDGHEYPTIKNEAEVQVGILTQCIKETTVNKINQSKGAKQVIINVLLKVNAKLGGLNFQLGKGVLDRFRFHSEPVLILGADVTHPAPHSKSPSVAAITASYDLSGMCFQMHIQVQGAAEEVISGFQTQVVNLLKDFKSRTKCQPKRIIMFRDGVSEGQFPDIKEKEYGGIVAACRSLNASYNPKITFLVVKKRHHTRFNPRNSTDAVKPKDNIPPGTCVDTVITHPTEMEYFLNSHVGIQGTSKPTRYHVIHDDSKFSMEELELLTYCLCYTFVRCTQPVSYPAPTYYAHLAAFRARALLEKEGDNADLNTLQQRMTIDSDLQKKYPMFFV